jgi:Thiamine pyrophosphate enzyme, N-terminal TPP binding domain
MSSNTSKTGAQIVVESLERHGVTHVFGIPGAKIDKVFDTLNSSSIETVVCRHEQNAAFIAGGIGRLTGRLRERAVRFAKWEINPDKSASVCSSSSGRKTGFTSMCQLPSSPPASTSTLTVRCRETDCLTVASL